MAVVRRSLDDNRRNTGRIDRAKVAATTEADIRRHMIEDGEDPDAPLPRELQPYISVAAVRAKVGLSQGEFATATGIPVATLRNWEQGRRRLDPTARALMRVIWVNPRAALQALGYGATGPRRA